MKLLFENWRAYCEKDFELLYESHRKGIITEERLIQLWEDNINREYQELLNEGVMDVLAVGWEKGKQLAGQAKAAYDAAVAKVGEWYMKLLNQAWALLQTVKQGLGKIAGVLKGVYQKISAFCEKHPILCKVTKFLIMMIAVAGVMALFSSEAQAAIDISGVAGRGEGSVLSDKGVDAVKGVLQIASEDKDPEVQQRMVDAYNWLEQAHASENIEQLATSQSAGAEKVRTALEVIKNLVEANPDEGVIQGFVEIGEKTVVNTTRYTESVLNHGEYSFKQIQFQSLKVR